MIFMNDLRNKELNWEGVAAAAADDRQRRHQRQCVAECSTVRMCQCQGPRHYTHYSENKLALYGTGGRLLLTANFKVT